jgi:hypothetical protein
MLLQITPEPRILRLNRILRNGRQEQECDQSTEETQRRRQVERVLALLDHIAASVVNEVWKDVGPDKSTDLSCRCGNAVVLSSDRGGGGFGGDETDVVTRSDFS